MDLTVFLIGTAFFAGGFFFLLFSLVRKRKLTIPFTLMGIGVVICFIGLILASPLQEDEPSTFNQSHLPPAIHKNS
ncbi:hypothetical protein ACFPTR_06245 [Aliibacillus thermotolerans]|uniref:Uncharacterized protein n=1 Tax=Aliibacillus thermotolerans TaxID=1834418 RepID=A0ABW0U7A7_9BACI|nr:hypothetical protein [Aliibacillus thermotolerans]MDA3129479.1 hypothetical protein [Aliibacillus thermotolerans]